MDIVDNTQSIAKPAAPERLITGGQLSYVATAGNMELVSFRTSLAGATEVKIGRGQRRCWRIDETTIGITIPDDCMSATHARLSASHGSWTIHDAGSKNGTFVAGERAADTPVASGQIIECGNSIFVYRDTIAHKPIADVVDSTELSREFCTATLHGGLADALANLRTVSESGLPILVTGETGTGKELLARHIHRLSRRRGKFIAVNCGAVASTLLESELFGHIRGAFSGAHQNKTGLIRASNGGTLFLDEVGELSPPAQVALLRVLQESEVVPVGSSTPIPINLRILAATHRDLRALVDEGDFREDLYARLAGYRFEMPRLANRLEDFGIIVANVAASLETKLSIDRTVLRTLMRHPWQRNIRELQQFLHAATATCDGDITWNRLPPALRDAIQPHAPSDVPSSVFSRFSDPGLARRLTTLLARHRGNVSAVARSLGKERNQVRRWCDHLDIDITSYRAR